MKRVLLFGSTGMAGSGVYAVLKDTCQLILPVRNVQKVQLLEKKYGGTKHHTIVSFDALNCYRDYCEKEGHPSKTFSEFTKRIGDVDTVINCTGIIIPHVLKNEAHTFFLNAAFPFLLSRLFGKRLIHLTTNCVFSGIEGFPYDEHSGVSPTDLYGLTKSMGEPSYESLVLRTSIVGRELGTAEGLLEWFLSQGKGAEVKGFQDHIWNGMTNIQFGKVCDMIISNRSAYPTTGLYHIFSPTTLSKYEMLKAFEEKYQTGCTIRPYRAGTINRQLATQYGLNSSLRLPSFHEMLAEL